MATNQAPVDKFTIAHFLTGMIFGLMNVNFWLVLLIASVFELIECSLHRWFPSIFRDGHIWAQESLSNQFMDVMAVVAGWATGLFILVEIFGI